MPTFQDETTILAVRQKFLTHRDIREVLLSTGGEELIENTTNDYYWGIGTDRTGKNMLGRILMEVREEIRAQVE